jgi:hypothetical protein
MIRKLTYNDFGIKEIKTGNASIMRSKSRRSDKKYRDSIIVLDKRYKELINAKKEYKLAKQYHDAPAFLQKIGNKVSELKEKKRIWNEIVKQWDEVEQASKEAEDALDKLDIAVDEGSKQKLLQSVSLVENSMKKIRQMSQLLRDMPNNFTQIKLQ